MDKPSAYQVVSEATISVAPADRAKFLREMLAYAAGALVITDGAKEAAEACYRVGDAVVQRLP